MADDADTRLDADGADGADDATGAGADPEAADRPDGGGGGEAATESAAGSPAGEAPVSFEEIDGPSPGGAEPVDQASRIRMLRDVALRVRVELGRGKMLLDDLLRLDRGSVVELDKIAGEPLDIYANDRLVARGEVLVLDDRFCIRITEILTPEECVSAGRQGVL